MWQQVKKGYFDLGIKTFWLDQAEPEVHPQQFGNLKFHIGNGAQTALAYPYYYAKTFYDGLKNEGINDIVLLTRCAYPGSQKYGTIVWNGDIPSNFDALRQSVVSGLSMSMSGIPWWNSDIGGFFGGDIESDWFRELIVAVVSVRAVLSRYETARNTQPTERLQAPPPECKRTQRR